MVEMGGISPEENRDRKSSVVRHFEACAEDWDALYLRQDFDGLHIQERMERVIAYVDQIGLAKGERVLELGCGAGRTTIELLRRGFCVDALDVSESMVNIARSNWEKAGGIQGVTFHVGDAEDLSFGSNSFGLVIAIGLIGWLTAKQQALMEMHRVIRPGGYLIVSVPNKVRLNHLLDWAQFFYAWMKWIARRVPGFRTSQIQRRTVDSTFYMPGQFDKLLCEMGFEILLSGSHGFGPFRLLRRRVLPDQVSMKLHYFLQKLSDQRRLPYLHRLGKTYIVVGRKPAVPVT